MDFLYNTPVVIFEDLWKGLFQRIILIAPGLKVFLS